VRLPNSAHTARSWRIHEIAYDFRLEDVWALPATGRREDFGRMVRMIAERDPGKGSSRLASALWAIRWKLGELLGWDEGGEATIRGRLPEDLREAPGPGFEGLPFSPLYELDDEFAAEISNRTMHGILHLGWVPSGDGYRGQMAVLVKPNGLFGQAYMAAIRPFRHLIVYPAMMREGERVWTAQENVTSGSSISAAPASHSRRAAADRSRGQPVEPNSPSVSTASVLPSQR
jgi:Protein of unknown function (DUF2867)